MSSAVHEVGIRISVDAKQAQAELPRTGEALNEMGRRGQQAAQGLRAAEMSAKQMAQALRTVPMQMTDVVTQLAAGTSPLQVLIQQGGQLKDSFGGVMPALRAVGGYVVGLVNPATLAAGALTALAVAAYKGSQEMPAYSNALILTGNAAGTTAERMAAMAREIAQGAHTQGAAAEALVEMARSASVGADRLQHYAGVALEWQRATGAATGEVAEGFAALAKSPLDAVLKLNEGANWLTASTYEQIKALADQGRQSEAARVAQDAWADALQTRAAQVEQNLGYMERGWRAVTDAAKSAWDAMLNVGRAQTHSDQLASMDSQLNRLRRSGGGDLETAREASFRQERIAQLEQQRQALLKTMEVERQAAEASAQRAQVEQARIRWSREGEKYLSRQAQMEREIARAVNEGRAAQIADADVQARVAQIREKYAEKTSRGLRTVRREAGHLREDMRALAQSQGLNPNFYEEWDKLQGAFKRGVISAQALERAQADLLARQPAMREAAAQERRALEAAAAARARLSEQEYKRVSDYARSVQEMAQGNEKLREEVQLLGLSRAEQQRWQQAKLDALIATKQEQLARLENEYVYTREQALLEEEIRLLRERADLMGQRDEKLLDEEAVKEAERSLNQLGQSLTDSLMRGGRSAAQYLKDLFRTMVLRPVIQAVVAPVAGAAGALLGAGAPGAGALGGAGSLLGLGGLFGQGGLTGALSAGAGWLTGAGSLGGALSSAGSLLGSGTLAGALQGAATAAGAVMPIVAAVAAIARLIRRFRRTPHRGAGAQAESGAQVQDINPATIGFGAQHDAAVAGVTRQYAQTVLGQIERVAAGFGQQGRFGVATAFADDSSRDGAWGALRITRDGQTMLDWNQNRASRWAPREFANGDAGAQQYLREVSRSTLDAFEALNLPEWARAQVAATRTQLEQLQGDRAGEQAAALVEQLTTSLGNMSQAIRQAIETIPQFAGATQDAVHHIGQLMGGVDQLSAAYDNYMGNFWSEAERRALTARQVQAQLQRVGVHMPDIHSADARAQFRALVEGADLSTQSGRELFATLMRVQAAFAQITQAAGEAADAGSRLADRLSQAQQATDTALEQLQRLASQQTAHWQKMLDAAQEAAERARGVFELAGQNARELRGQTRQGRQAQAEQGRLELARMLAQARQGGALPEQKALERAVAGVRAGLDVNRYASMAEWQRDQLVLAGQLEQMQETAGGQLSEAEQQVALAKRQIEFWEDQMEHWRLQIDLLRGVDRAALSLDAGVAKLVAAMEEERAARQAEQEARNKPAAPGAGSAGGAGFGGGSAPAGGQAAHGSGIYSTREAAEQALQALGIGSYAQVFHNPALGGWQVRELTEGSADRERVQRLREGMTGLEGNRDRFTEWVRGQSVLDVAAATGYMADDVVRFLEANGYRVEDGRVVPAYARGGWHGGGLALVGEEGPELVEFDRPAWIRPAGQTRQLLEQAAGAGSDALAAQMQQAVDLLRQLLLRTASADAHVAALGGVISRLSSGGMGALRAEIVAVQKGVRLGL